MEVDHCAYFCDYGDENFFSLLLYIHDMMVTRNSKSQISNLKTQLAEKFEIKNLGAMNQILEMNVLQERKNRKVWLLQKRYVEKVLWYFDM